MPGNDRRALWLLSLCLVCTGIGQAVLFAILPPAAREIGLSPLQVSTIFVTSACLWVFVSPMWGRRSDVVGRRPVILIGLLGFALSMFLLAGTIGASLAGWLAPALAWPLMIASRSVFALLGSGTAPASQAYVADRTSREDRTAGVALINAAFGIGQIAGPAVGGLAILGLLTPLYFAAALSVASAIAIWLFLPEAGPVHATERGAPARVAFTDSRILPFVAIGIAQQAVGATTAITLAFFLQDMLGLTPDQTGQRAAMGFAVLAIAGLAGQLLVVQRLKPLPSTLMHGGLAASLVAFVLFNMTGGFGLYVTALAFLGLGLGLLRPGNAAGASLSVEPEEQGAVAGITGAISVLGNVFGPLLGTALYELSPRGPYLLNGILMALGLAYSFAHPRLRSVRP